MTEEIKTQPTAGQQNVAVPSSPQGRTVDASVRGRTESSRQRFNPEINRRNPLLEMLPVVRRIALKMRERLPAHVEADELIADGVLGLVDAVAKFDANKRVKLETYASHRVRGAILDGLRNADPASRDLRRKNKEIQTLYRQLEVKLRRPVRDDEMASALGMNLAKWHRRLNQIQKAGFEDGVRRLTAGHTSKSATCQIDPELLLDGSPDPFALCYRHEQSGILGRALSGLRDRERDIIIRRYQQGLTMKQIAGLMRVDASRVSQLHAAALGRLKAGVESLLRPAQAEIRESATLSMSARHSKAAQAV